jgi:DNA polymerase III subunit delta
MAKKTSSDIQSFLKGTLPQFPVLFLQGEEEYFIDQVVHRYEKELVPEGERSFNLIILYGRDVSMMQVVGQAKAFPFIGQRQVVIVKETQAMEDLKRDEAATMLERYIAQPQPSTLLLFAHPGKVLDGRKALSKKLDSAGVLVTSAPVYDSALAPLIKAMFQEQKLQASEQIVTILKEHVGNDLTRLAKEIEKLGIAAGGRPLTSELVFTQVGISKDYNVFELQEAIGGRKLGKALQIGNYFAANPREHPIIKELSLLNSYFLRVVLLHHAKQNNSVNLAAALNVSPYALKDVERAAASYNLPQALSALQVLLETDCMVKGVEPNSMDEQQLWQNALLRIIGVK